MKSIRYSLIFIISLIAIFTLNSCSDAADENHISDNYRSDIATIYAIDTTARSFYLKLDDGSTLLPASFDPSYKPSYNKRAIVDYTILSDKTSGYDHIARINAISDIATKGVIDLTRENEKEIGNDPIKILDLWAGDHFLNIHYGYNTGGEKLHTINLVRNNQDKIISNPNGTIVLEFRHNKNGDPERYGIKNYAAFDLKPFQIPNQNSVNLIIKILDFNNESKEYPITYKYN